MLVIMVALVLAVLTFLGMLGHLDRPATALGNLWHRLRRRPPAPATVSVERLAADLRRLATVLEQTYATEQPAKMARLTAASLAYDWVLLAACRTLEIPTQETAPLDAIGRLQTEAELARSGLDW